MSFIRRNGRIYLAEVESKRVGKKVQQKIIRYIGLSLEMSKKIYISISNSR